MSAAASPKSSDNSSSGAKQSEPNATVESLLFNLDKIDRESELLLNYDGKQQRYSHGLDGNSVKSEKLNSILSFLDDAATNESNKFTQKDFSEYNYDIEALRREIERENEKKIAAATAVPTPRKNRNRKASVDNGEKSIEKSAPRANSARKPTNQQNQQAESALINSPKVNVISQID